MAQNSVALPSQCERFMIMTFAVINRFYVIVILLTHKENKPTNIGDQNNILLGGGTGNNSI